MKFINQRRFKMMLEINQEEQKTNQTKKSQIPVTRQYSKEFFFTKKQEFLNAVKISDIEALTEIL